MIKDLLIEIDEGATRTMVLQFLDENGVPITVDPYLISATLRITDRISQQVVRATEDIKPLFDNTATALIKLRTQDNAILSTHPRIRKEIKIVTIEAEIADSPTSIKLKKEFYYTVVNHETIS